MKEAAWDVLLRASQEYRNKIWKPDSSMQGISTNPHHQNHYFMTLKEFGMNFLSVNQKLALNYFYAWN